MYLGKCYTAVRKATIGWEEPLGLVNTISVLTVQDSGVAYSVIDLFVFLKVSG